MNLREIAASLPLVILVFFIGLYPNAALQMIHMSASNLIQQVNAKVQHVPAMAQAVGSLLAK